MEITHCDKPSGKQTMEKWNAVRKGDIKSEVMKYY